MKKYLLVIGVGAMVLSSGCDPMNQEGVIPADETAKNGTLANGLSGDLNARTSVQWPYRLGMQADRNYQMMENVYPMILAQFPKAVVEEQRMISRDKSMFVESMIKNSIQVFDKNIFAGGRFLSPLSRANHQAMAGTEHEIEYDILAFSDDETAAFDAYLKIPDIDGESAEEASFNFAKIDLMGGNSSAAGCGYCNDSFPPIKASQIEETIEFWKKIDRWNAEPSQTNAALLELELSAGLDPVAIGLLLPAVQKVREAARINGRGKADILWESLLTNYGIDLGDQKGKFMRYGGAGSIGELISKGYDDEGDLDWASIQLNRRKFELEMLFLWSRYWDQMSGNSTPGR